jgi:tRNA(fMet)-specific endonuclease VapC
VRILDTDHCIEILRGNAAVAERRAEVADLVATTWVSEGELYYGAARSDRPDANRRLVAAFLATLPVLGPAPGAAEGFGSLKAGLEASGRRLPDADLWIAAAALEEGATLITGNERHYARVPGLRTESWIPRQRKCPASCCPLTPTLPARRRTSAGPASPSRR